MTYNPYEDKNTQPFGTNPEHPQRDEYTELNMDSSTSIPEQEKVGDFSETFTPQQEPYRYSEPTVEPPVSTSEPDYSVDEYYKEHFADESISADSYAKYGESFYSEEKNAEPENTSSQSYENIYSSTPYYNEQPRTVKPEKVRKPVSRGALAVVLAICIMSSMLLGIGGGFFAAKIFSSDSSSGNALNLSQSDDDSSTYASSTSALTTTQIVQKAADSVVEITTESVATSNFSQQYIQSGAGSGVIIAKEGYIVTNYHVVEGATNITVTLRDKTEYTDVKVVGTYAAGDIALLKITPKKTLKPATIGNSEKITVGDYAVAIGNPLGQLGGSVTDGIISALGREVTIDNETFNLLQTNAEISPGNSGGGLFNGNGELIGIVNAKSSEDAAEGIGFAIPVNDVMDVISDLKQYGYVKGQIELGMSVTDVNSTAQLWLYGSDQTGVYVTSVNSGSNAAKAGFKAGDIITGIDSTEIETTADLKAALKKHKVGDKVKFTVYRSGQKGSIEMTLEESKSDVGSSDSSSKQQRQQQQQMPDDEGDDWGENPWSIFN